MLLPATGLPVKSTSCSFLREASCLRPSRDSIWLLMQMIWVSEEMDASLARQESLSL